MKRKNIFVVMAIAILVLSISPVHGVLINPYKDWIETKDLKNCTIYFVFDSKYVDSGFDEGSHKSYEYYLECRDMRFENGEFDSANNTFSASNITETYGQFGITVERILKKECQIVFDSGANNIKSFSALVTDEYTKSYGDFSELVTSIKGFGSHFPFLKELWAVTEWPESEDSEEWTDSEWEEVIKIDTKNTSYVLSGYGGEESWKYLKSIDIIIKEKRIIKIDDKYKTWTRELESFKFPQEYAHIDITFNGYLPRLRDSKGNCSWFGGPDDTGIDVRLRKIFYAEGFEGEYNSKIFEDKEVSYAFNEWMNNTPRLEWERTGLQCGKARELDTENDYFCAMRWHDKETEGYNAPGEPGSQDWWREQKIKVTNTENNMSVIVAPVDWGPHVDTDRVIDLSKKAINTLGAGTDTTIVEMCIVDSNTPLGPVTNRQNNKNVNEK